MMNKLQQYTRFVFLLLFVSAGMPRAFAQDNIILKAPTTGTHKASGSITLKDTFEVVYGNTFRAYIDKVPAITVPLRTTPSSNRNYIITYTTREAGITDPADTSNTTTEVNPVIQYFDVLGRPDQTVAVKGSPDVKDIVQPIYYDAFGRESKKYLPYTVTGTGDYKSSAFNADTSFYKHPPLGVVNTNYPFAQTLLENSPLNRVKEQGAPGASWQLSAGHTLVNTYDYNAASTVRLWTISAGTVTGTSYYAANTLYKNTVTDENEGHTIEYKDREGRIILKQVEATSGNYLSSYYVYDQMDNLAYVIPPAVTVTSFNESTAEFNQFIYAYKYDGKKRVIEKKIPGKGWEFMVYNKMDQLIMSQDSMQRSHSNQDWTITKYDVQGRAIISGIFTHSGSSAGTNYRSTIQGYADAVSTQWEAPLTTGNGYTANTYPTSWTTTLSINYYDDYTFPGGTTYTYGSASTMTKSLPTGSRINVLGTSDMLLSINFYDDEGRVAKAFAPHYKGGTVSSGNYDAVTNTYDFTNALVTSTRQHYVSSSLALTVLSEYQYDHTGRKRRSFSTINGGTKTMLSQLDYNTLGQLADKAYHSLDTGYNGLQKQYFTYNERGWLKTSTAPLFAMELKYDNGTLPQYNGNISNQVWGTEASLGITYSYNYDLANRLLKGASSEGYDEKSIVYDAMGNIQGLRRYIPGATSVDQLKYNYSGNQLTSVADTVTANTSANFQLPGTTAYTYDGNGNMKSRINSSYTTNNITDITYNILNLPNVVDLTNDITYTYDASGRKLKKAVAGGDTREYINGIEYKNGSIEFVQTEEGRAMAGSPYIYQYTLTDHLGNNRLNFESNSGVVREIQGTDYYPFGLEINKVDIYPTAKNQYLYNGKELQAELKQYDYGARFYDPVIGRWNVVDPKAEDYYNWSPYNYGFNDPIRMIDPDGRGPIPGLDMLIAVAKHKVQGLFGLVKMGQGAQDLASVESRKADPAYVDKVPAKVRQVNDQLGKRAAQMKMAEGELEFFQTAHTAMGLAMGGVEGGVGSTAKTVASTATRNLKLSNSVSDIMGDSYKAMGEVTTPIKNTDLLGELNAASKGDWTKVYEAGLQNGNKIETHYFRNNTTGSVFDVKTKYQEWHQKAFKNLEE